MNTTIREQLENMFRQAQAGFFGPQAQQDAEYYHNLPAGFAVFYAVLQDFYAPVEGGNTLLFQPAEQFAQLLMLVYRETKVKDPAFAAAYLTSFIEDFPGTSGTALVSRWDNLATVAIGFRSLVAHHPTTLSMWNASKALFEAYNEFLNGLLGYLIVGWQIVTGKTYSLNTFSNAYGNKVDVFSQLTDGENGVFCLVHRLVNPGLRNAIAHGDAHLNQDQGIIVYSDGKGSKRTQYTMPVVNFVGFAGIGSHLARADLAAIAGITVYEYDRANAQQALPPHIYQLLDSPPRIV